ncbi:hypothetical protein BP00DRAFT_64285 [Aspergillus indologenus CBS 114.80]|uniref:Uncharacterized protein n=1 Tax=Aspergillus indologenus CBS 114.80 TaxID=1450541 RepID=A0A2V5HRF5_9EURO|nr:hypothetical protein BP00DRAFT_64285 [Aspergillus indologenus CBS 114.80]
MAIDPGMASMSLAAVLHDAIASARELEKSSDELVLVPGAVTTSASSNIPEFKGSQPHGPSAVKNIVSFSHCILSFNLLCLLLVFCWGYRCVNMSTAKSMG